MIGRNSEIHLRGERYGGPVRFGPYRFVAGDGVWQGDRPVTLPPRALAVLAALLAKPGVVVSKQELMESVWPDTFVTDSSLLEAVGVLRDVLGDDRRRPRYIQTVHRRGYRFVGVSEEPRPGNIVEASEELPPFFSGPEWRPIVAACVTYAVTTVGVALVFAIFGRPLPARAIEAAAAPRFGISHAGALLLPNGTGSAVAPSWTPAGLEIAFAFSKAGPFNLSNMWDQFPTSRSRDGLLAVTELNPFTGADIWVLDLRTGMRRLLVRSMADETWARFSPDGRQIAYMSNESGRWEVYVRPIDGSSRPVRVSTDGGSWPSWSADGRVHFSTRTHGRAELRIVLDWFSELATPRVRS
jgi:DNA-binding winged helix-turn-helix (wHTH) protein